jgi:N-acetylglucosaminyl-diphospho-decaprenol L-rhamnosyltransferase
MDSRPALSIIIVNWNVRDLARKCVLSLRREMLLPAGDYELIVVDNASADGSAAMFRSEFPEITLIESPVNLGFGAGCNRAYRVARGEFVLLLNPDTEVVDHALDGILGILRSRPDAAIVAPRLVNGDRSFQRAAGGALPTLANVAWNYLFLKDILPAALAPPPLFLEGDPQGLLSLGWVSGASMLLRREAVGEEIFDESFFMFGEDMDVCDRVRRKGWEVLYASAHSIVHHHGKSFDQQHSLEIRVNAHDGPRRVFAKRRGAFSIFLYDAILFAGFLIRWPLYGALSLLRPDRGYGARSDFSRSYLRAMLHRRPGSGPDPATPRRS